MWDPETDQKIDDQTNSVWYFGQNGGLNFNPTLTTRMELSPAQWKTLVGWNLPAGTTTISDQTGQVLFYTDGQTVWDLNGNVMEGGQDIGGDNSSSQSVVAVPIPQEESLYYLFTTESASGGSNQVKFSLVDIKGENPSGVGSVVSGDNFLFSPGTEQAAALTAGDTTWMMFHEMGNNSFRAYPITMRELGNP
ncbi:hypothetical protein QWY93_18830 [Echinicola jeungdonensis]|uniref:hypothetical protein n=1 Tax=Echinicola jeungdonensis TaxID=709343 RepID=UPI0025B38343|nr:hypothetical protein [Echinicola jeungdonensis]MDN3671327.1 hypothetical protein [Echinicola jeungdonensis]